MSDYVKTSDACDGAVHGKLLALDMMNKNGYLDGQQHCD